MNQMIAVGAIRLVKNLNCSLKRFRDWAVGNLDRNEAISLLKELGETFHTFKLTQYVLLKNRERKGLGTTYKLDSRPTGTTRINQLRALTVIE